MFRNNISDFDQKTNHKKVIDRERKTLASQIMGTEHFCMNKTRDERQTSQLQTTYKLLKKLKCEKCSDIGWF